MLYDIQEFAPGEAGLLARCYQVDPGSTCGIYAILNGAGTTQIGWLVEIAGANVTSSTNYIWYANQAYWFWTSGSPFPAGFRLQLYAMGTVPTWNPANANQITTSGPFDLSGTVTPIATGTWWTIQKNSTGVGYLSMQTNGDQYWYETAPNQYLSVTGSDQLIFNNSSAPTTLMYQNVASLISTEVLAARATQSAETAAAFR
jgi:hypothetical protein